MRARVNRETKSHSRRTAPADEPKRSFDIEVVLDRIRTAVAFLPKAALFELAADGYNTPFEQLVACILSIRTRDEVTVPTARALFARARTPREVDALDPKEIDALIGQSTFHTAKAYQIHDLADRVVDEFEGKLPCDEKTLLSFRGVGPKCANLVLGIACGQPGIGVDVHVHRVTNRWGYANTSSPEQTMTALRDKLPREYSVELNSLLVPFGKHICTGWRPHCSTCPVLDMCQQVTVVTHR